ncbi:SSI family serine proteinase inhibitor [Streptomyces monticola]|uniref:SSI family serine proteinase inhibitor n=1 Tax=Streptomyces monticola TaxID=2666263 RepID=A0ABW2JAN7_9ACTN
MTVRTSRVGLALATGALVLAGSPAASAATTAAVPPPPSEPGSKLILMHHEGTADEVPSKASFALLACDPPGGTHPATQAACGRLRETNGDIEELDAHPDRVCTKEYQPVTVHAYGHWKGATVHRSKTFGNACQAEAATAEVFGF